MACQILSNACSYSPLSTFCAILKISSLNLSSIEACILLIFTFIRSLLSKSPLDSSLLSTSYNLWLIFSCYSMNCNSIMLFWLLFIELLTVTFFDWLFPGGKWRSFPGNTATESLLWLMFYYTKLWFSLFALINYSWLDFRSIANSLKPSKSCCWSSDI